MEKIMEKRDLWEKKELIILVGLHCDLTRLRSTRAGLVMRSERLAQTEFRIDRLGGKYLALLRRIQEYNPGAQIVTTIPYTPDVRRYAARWCKGRALQKAGITSLELREDEHYFRADVAAFIVWWEANVGWPLFEMENLREEGFEAGRWPLTYDGVHPSPHTREQFWRGMRKWLPRAGNIAGTMNIPLPGPSKALDDRIRVEGEYIEEEEYGEITPLPQRSRKRRERRRWENEVESEDEMIEREITRREKGTLIEQMKKELLKKRGEKGKIEQRRGERVWENGAKYRKF